MAKHAAKASIFMALLMGTSAWAATTQEDRYQTGDTVLGITQDGYAMQIRDPLVNPGGTTRLYFRPLNGNCTSAASSNFGAGVTIQDDPACRSLGAWGYVSLNVPNKAELLAVADNQMDVRIMLGGTRQSYKVAFTAALNSSGQVFISSLRIPAN